MSARDQHGRRFIRVGGRFPLRGKTRRARRNRVIAATAGLTALGVGAVALTGAGRYMGPLSSLTGTTGYVRGKFGKNPAYHVFHSDRPAKGHERKLAGLIARAPGGRKLLRRLNVRPRGPHGSWEVRGVPVSARLHAHMRKRLAERIESGSLWNIAGKGRLLHGIETGALHGAEHARRLVERPIKAVGEAADRLLSGKLARGEHVLARTSRRLARRVRRVGLRLEGHRRKKR